MALLSQDQYLTINQHRSDLDCLVDPNCGYVRNLDQNWLRTIQQIHSSVLRCPYFDIQCRSCLYRGLTQLQNLVAEYEAEKLREKEELDRKIQEEINDQPRQGRKTKDWVVVK